ncbi:MAG: hypothetical protein ACI4KB_08350 [Oscillospiraceae bacterium]|nr:hypothetical protein [Oscillospiraceae bacterium]
MPHIRPITDLRNTIEFSEILLKLLTAQRQIDNGEGLDGEEILKKLREKYNISRRFNQ